MFIIGPIVPLIPTQRYSSGHFDVWAAGFDACPLIVQESVTARALQDMPHNGACQYSVDSLDLTKPLVVQGSESGNRCETSPVQYKKDVIWDYCLMCTA